MSWIQTFTRKRFDLLKPEPEMIDIRDIAHGLANECRFSNQCDEFYSVAQHSWLVSECCQPWDALWGLLHDAAEAYVGDVARPLKQNLPDYVQIERRIEMTIATKFRLIGRDPNDFLRTRERVKHWDDVVLATEARDLHRPPTVDGWCRRLPPPMLYEIIPLGPRAAERYFLKRFEELTRGQMEVANACDASGAPS
jgi:hypothetical protein